MKKLTQILMVTYSLMLLSSLNLNAQVDQTFWFVAPETTRNHAKTPGILRITAFENAAVVKISQPANSDFHPITITVPANSQEKVEFHDYGQNIKAFNNVGNWVSNQNIEPPRRADNSLIYEQMLWSIENGTMDAVRWNNALVLDNDWTGFPTNNSNPVVASPDQIPILNKGLLIESTNGANIAVYYEVANPRNPERFNLKGRNALGKEFLIPSQNRYYNLGAMAKAREKVDIVATENNTTITINFDRNIHHFVGKPTAGNSFSITLDRGQTFSLRSNSQLREHHLGGIFVQSDQNIAVTISDDSIIESENHHHYDLVGDQLIPITITGTRYIAMHPSFGTKHQDQYENSGNTSVSNLVFIWPVGDPTVIRINGEAVKDGGGDKLFSRGEFHVENISDNGIFIETNQPVIVYQVSSYKYELGSAVLPALECTGSKQVSFARIYNANFFIQILTKNKNILDNNGQNNFEAYYQQGNSTVDVTNELFSTSTASSAGWTLMENTHFVGEEQWYSFVKYFPQDIGFPTGVPITVKFKESAGSDAIYDDELFHLSVLDANGASMSFGYFSSYNSVAISGPSALCIGKDVELRTNGIMADWYHAPNDVEPFETGKNLIYVTEPGEYWVEIPNSSCQSSDPVIIDYIIPDFDLGADTTVCPGEPVDLGIEELEYPAEYSWFVNDVLVPDNQTFEYSFVTEPNNTYHIILNAKTNVDGIECEHADTIVVTTGPEPFITLDAEEEVCAGSELRTAFFDFLTYEWVFPDGTISNDTYIFPVDEGTYTLTVSTADGCTLTQDIDVTIHDLPVVDINDDAVCPGDIGEFNIGPNSHTSILWFNGATTQSIQLQDTEEEYVWVEVTDNNGCINRDTASFTIHNLEVFDFSTIYICPEQQDFEIEINDNFFNYEWSFKTDHESSNPAIEITDDSNLNPWASYHVLTVTTSDPTVIPDPVAGRYYVKAQDQINNCPVEGFFDLVVTPVPKFEFKVPEFVQDSKICEGDTIKIEFNDPHGRDFDGYEWSFVPEDGSPEVHNLSTNPWIEATIAGTYILLAKMENGCNARDSVPIKTVPAPELAISDQEACPGETIELQLDAYVSNYNDELSPDAYEWLKAPAGMEITDQYQVIDTSPIYIVDNETKHGSYRLTVFNGMGCFASAFANASSYDTPNIEIEDDTICLGQDYLLSIPENLASIDGQYSWYLEGEPALPWYLNEDLSVSPSEAGIYSYYLIFETNDGCITSGTMTLTVLPSPTLDLPPSGEICKGETISITAEDSYESYVWNGVAGDHSFQVNTSGNISLVVTDENGCTTSATTALTIRDLPNVSIANAEACPDEIISLSVEFDPEVYNIMWTLPNGRTIRNTNTIETVEGTYSVMVADDLGCAGRDDATVSWLEFPWVYFSPGNNLIDMCPFQLPVEIEADGDFPTWDEIHWHDGEFENERRRTANLSDTVNVIRVKNTDGCWSRASQSVLLALPTLYEVGRNVEGCEPTDGIPFVEKLDAGVYTIYEDSTEEPIEVPISTYHWYTVNEAGVDTLGTDQTLLAKESGQYVIEIFDGCWMHRDTFNIDLYPTPSIAGIDSTIYRQVTVFAEGGTEPYSYTLNDQAPQNEKTFKNLENGEYTVYVIDNHGCEASTHFLFESNMDITVPNFFTPNGDGYNDTWVIEGIEKLPESIIYIYDRYGKLLKKYGSNDPVWNGEYLNQAVPSDDYWYVIHLLPVNKYIRGHFTLKR
ncbi:T9SS type B sorting domain-containing protein [Geofilum rubicundum]|uniref:IgGFc-binding protein N-terminal domain-containing protein n=1 Tax=Geofilum rubicundum JCM 15548 TaxID=1236989 RepID=A0A0E9M2G0_9BACT|nr:T9SS type B sorting domain-containing protein [Geofilum rubicundum]GAO31704.1 hypothetical protein JCM15548_14094 [Geofilum rubicundum JCM 15548]